MPRDTLLARRMLARWPHPRGAHALPKLTHLPRKRHQRHAAEGLEGRCQAGQLVAHRLLTPCGEPSPALQALRGLEHVGKLSKTSSKLIFFQERWQFKDVFIVFKPSLGLEAAISTCLLLLRALLLAPALLLACPHSSPHPNPPLKSLKGLDRQPRPALPQLPHRP